MSKTSYISKELPVELIDDNPDNKTIYDMDKINELINAINEDGFTDPIGVYDMENGRYEIFSGHKRFYAEKQRNESTIGCLVFQKPANDVERARRLIRSNILNRDTKPLTRARELNYYYENVIIPENKQGQKLLHLAEAFGMSIGQVSKHLALLDLIPELQELANNPNISFSSFSTASKLSEEQQKLLYEMILYKKDENGDFHVTRDEIISFIKQIKEDDNPKFIPENNVNMVNINPNNVSPVLSSPITPIGGQETVSVTPAIPTVRPVLPTETVSSMTAPVINIQPPLQKPVIDYALQNVVQEIAKYTSLNYQIENKNNVHSSLCKIKELISAIESKL